MSRPRKQRISGFLSCRKIFYNFFRSYLYSFFLYLLFHQIKQILLQIYLEYLGKGNKQTNKQTKQNKKKLIRFISPALLCGLPYSSLFICVFFFFFFFFLLNTEQGGQELEFSESLKRRNFLSGSQ